MTTPPLASHTTTVAHAAALLGAPQLGAEAVGVVDHGDTADVVGVGGGFVRVRRAEREGFLPAALCAPLAYPGQPGTVHVIQPVALYRRAEPGSQWSATAGDPNPFLWMAMPEEPLLALGRDGDFVLIQRPNGLLGFVPAVLCGDLPTTPPARSVRGLEALGWGALGGGWTLLNWSGLYGVLTNLPALDAQARPYLGIGALLIVAGWLWLGSRRKLMARSFATGMLLCYGLMHLLSDGQWTMWRA